MGDRQTALYYDDNAAAYAGATLGLSMDVPLRVFSARLPLGARILDVGCGSGRDLREFRDQGYRPVGLDVSLGLARYAAQASNCPIVVADMLNLPFSDRSFDGVWASASILHIARSEMPRALREMRRVIKEGGVVFSSLKLGEGEARTSDNRFFTYVMPEEWRALLNESGFKNVDIEVDNVPSTKTGERWVRSLAG